MKLESTRIIDIEEFVDAIVDRPHLLGRALLPGAVGQDRHRGLRRDPRRHGEAEQGGARPAGDASARAHLRARAARRRHPAHHPAHATTRSASADEVFDRNLPKPDPHMLQIAEKIIEQQEAEFDPSEFKDRYEDALRDLIERKRKGEKLVTQRGARGRRQGRRPDGCLEQEPQGRRRPVAREGRPLPGSARPQASCDVPQGGQAAEASGLSAEPQRRLDDTAAHIAVDMQGRLFAEPTEWFVPWLPKVLPDVLAVAERHPDRTIFTRFIPPQDPEHVDGAWRDYYQRWRSMTRDRIDPHLLELVEPLRKLVPPAKVLSKSVYSAFGHPKLAHSLRRRGITTLIVTGGETDVCVLATVMAAADCGFHVVLPDDALCSGRTRHDALMKPITTL